MLREINDDVARAIEGVNDPRLKFVDVWSLQQQNVGKYADLIHHSGPLSVTIVEQILQSLAADGAVARGVDSRRVVAAVGICRPRRTRDTRVILDALIR